MRVTLDANVIIAAFAARGLCQSVFELCLDSHEIFLSEPFLNEISRNLEKKLKLPVSTVEEIERFLRSQSSLVEPADVDPEICRDRKDLMVLGTALAAEAAFLVTGDEDLLLLKRYHGFKILQPRAFWEKVKKQGDR
jgi:putative PIN family toxin of toxin-antitoxin system